MKILSIVNVSNTDDLTCDSGVIYQRILSKHFSVLGVEYHVVVPRSAPVSDENFGYAILHRASLGTTRYASRFSFPWEELASIVRQGFDVIFNNQVEITSALRALLVQEGQNKTRLVSYCHYPALWPNKGPGLCFDQSLNHAQLGLPIVLDILSAACVADCLIVQSNFAKQLIINSAEHFHIGASESLNLRIKVIPPPLDPAVTRPPASVRKRAIVYNHRLYESYGTNDILNFVDSLSHLSMEFWVMDPMPRRSLERSRLNSSPALYRERIKKTTGATLWAGNVERSEYAAHLAAGRLALAPWREACVWSMAVLDCMALGVPVVAPAYASYPEFIPELLLFHSADEARNLVQKLLNDESFHGMAAKQCLESSARFTGEIIAGRLMEVFKAFDTGVAQPCVE
jgi:glycosyltransferase involved in cell wall biosynthesis